MRPFLASGASWAAGAGLAVWLSLGAAAAAPEDNMSIRVGTQAVPPDEVYASTDWGKPYNLKVDLKAYSSGGDILKAFLGRQLDVGNGGSARLVTMAVQQPDQFYIVAANQYGGDRYGVMVPKASPVTSVSELKGKKIGAVTGSGAYNTFRVYLEKNGMKESDFQLVNMKVEDLRAAVQQGLVDAGVAWEPHVAIAETMGVVRRIQSMEGVNESPNFVLVSREFADKNPEAVTRYVATLIDLANLITSNSVEAARLAAQEISKKGVQTDVKGLQLALTRIKMNPKVTDGLLSELVPIAVSMHAAGKIASVPDFKKLVRYDFYDAALKLSTASNRAR
jgi:ABC-type nitrate/sulfonate/bicarbonate transport system substrate-binding protein